MGNKEFLTIQEAADIVGVSKQCLRLWEADGKITPKYTEGGKTTRFPDNILNFKCVDNYSRVHFSQKPVELLEYLIKTYTNENDVILDCFAGSGSTLVAAKNLNRQFIGIEKEKEYYDICLERLK